MYDELKHRVIVWDKTDNTGNYVETGIYRVVYFNGSSEEYGTMAIIK